MKRKSFTLIELLVVIAIIGLLSSIVLVSLSGIREKARDTKRKADIDAIKMALELYYDRYGYYVPEHLCTDTSIGCGSCGCSVSNYPNGTDWGSGNDSDLRVLITEEFLGQLPIDPINNSTYYYYFEPLGLNQGTPPCSVNSCGWTLRATLEAGGTYTLTQSN
jgi:prepilin-type N-terminal cleavage/methylation domain-containing protein